MKNKKLSTILFLLLWTLVLGVVYWSLAETPYTIFVSAVYAIAAVVLFVFFLLVNGGWRSLPSEENRRAEKEAAPPPRADLFHLGTEKQEKAARWLLAIAAPFFFILMADYLYLHFFFKG